MKTTNISLIYELTLFLKLRHNLSKIKDKNADIHYKHNF